VSIDDADFADIAVVENEVEVGTTEGAVASTAPSVVPTSISFSWGDAQHHGHAEHVGLVSQHTAYVQGGPQPDFSAQHERGTTSAQLQQMNTVLFPPDFSGYNSATNSTARDQNRQGWTDGSTLPPAYNPEHYL
jgi:hypothetical protein